MNEQRHDTPPTDRGRGRGSAGRALIADEHSVPGTLSGVNANPADMAQMINMKAEALCDRLIDDLPPHIRPRVWMELHRIRRDAIRWQDENTFAWGGDYDAR